MMQAEELFHAIGYIDDALILRSDRKKKKKNWYAVYGGVMVSAACLALMFGANWLMNKTAMDGLQTTISSEPTQTGGDGNGPDYYDPTVTPVPDEYWTKQEEAKDYGMMPELGWVDFNPGPIMPLTLADAKEGITAERELTYDFSTVSKEDNGYVPITDRYVLANTTGEDETVTLYYPYVSDIKDLNSHMPQIAVDGVAGDIQILNGAYYGEDSNGSLRLFDSGVSTDEYSSMLEEMKPLKDTIEEEVLQQNVVVCEVVEWNTENVPQNIATYTVRFKVEDPNKVFTAHSYTTEYDGEYLQVSFNRSALLAEQATGAVYFLGEGPIECLEQGYLYVDTTDEYKTDKVTAKLKQYESTVEEVLRAQMEVQLKKTDKGAHKLSKALEDLYFERMAYMFRDMYNWANDGKNTPEDEVFYEKSISDIAYTAWDCESMYLLSETISIPAGSSIKVDFEYEKSGACNTYEPQEEFRDNYCYDNMPNLLTNIKFTEQVATIEEAGNIRIEDQNYQFDLDEGIKKVQLALDAERYYMIVKMLK